MRKKESSTNKIGGSTVGEVIRGTPVWVPYRKLAPFLFGGEIGFDCANRDFLTLIRLLSISLVNAKEMDERKRL